MAATLVRKVMLKIAADDGDTEAKLDKIAAKAEELSRLHPDLTPKINTAAASAKLAVLKKELKDSQNQAGQTGSGWKALAGVANALTLGLSGGVGQMTLMQKAMAGIGVATGLGEPLLAGLTVVVGGLSAGLVSAGLGLGAFGLVAKSNLTTAMTAANQVQKAQIAYNAAIAHGTKQATAYNAEQKAIAIAYAQLSPAQIAMASQLNSAQNAWQSFVQSNTAGVDKILTKGIGLLPKVFAAMQPFMAPAEKALGGLVSELGKGLGSSGFKDWIDAFAKASGPNITNIGHAIGNIVVGIGGILKAFLPMATTMTGGLDKLTGKFAHWGTTLSQHSGFKSLESMAKTDGPLLIGVLKNLGGTVKNLLSDMAGLSTFSNSRMLLQLLGPLTGFIKMLSSHPDLVNLALWGMTAYGGLQKAKVGLDAVKSGIGAVKGARSALQDLNAGFSNSAAAASDATGAWGTAGGKISTILSGIGGTASKAWSGIVKGASAAWSGILSGARTAWTGLTALMAANPVAVIILALVALGIAFYELWKHFKGFRDFWKDAWHDIASIFDKVRHAIATGFDFIVKVVRTGWNDIKKATGTVWGWIKGFIDTEVRGVRNILGWFGHLGQLFRGWWDDATHAVESAWDRMGAFVRSIPHRILSALGDMGHLLWNAGISILSGFLGGLIQKFNDVKNFIGGIGSWIAAHKGPVSYDAVLLRPHGRAIMGGLVSGLQDGVPPLNAQLLRITHSVASTRIVAQLGAQLAVAPGAAGRGGVLQIEWVGGSADQALITLLKHHIRIRGGDPSVLGA